MHYTTHSELWYGALSQYQEHNCSEQIVFWSYSVLTIRTPFLFSFSPLCIWLFSTVHFQIVTLTLSRAQMQWRNCILIIFNSCSVSIYIDRLIVPLIIMIYFHKKAVVPCESHWVAIDLILWAIHHRLHPRSALTNNGTCFFREWDQIKRMAEDFR